MRRRQQQKGSAIVEGALVLLIFILLFLALADVARMIYAYNEMPYLAREGARYAAVHGSSSSSPLQYKDVASKIKTIAAGVDQTQLQISVNGDTSQTSTTALASAPASVTVIVTYTLNPVFKKILGSSLNVSGQSIM